MTGNRHRMSALHLKISSMFKHFDDLNTLLFLLECNLHFSMSSYSQVSTPTESTAGEVILYILLIVSFLNQALPISRKTL